MKFNNLKAYIRALETDSSPSLFMALCAVESLFYDFEEEADISIEKMEQGNEAKMPSKLLYVIRTLGEIYGSNAAKIQSVPPMMKEKIEALARAEDELEKIVPEIEAAETRLKELEDESDILSKKQLELGKLNADSEKAEREVEKLRNETEEKEKRLRDMGLPDVGGAKKKLAEIERQLAETEQQKNETDELNRRSEIRLGELEAQKKNVGSSKSVFEDLQRKIAEAHKTLESLGIPDVDGAEKELADTEERIAETKKQLAETERLTNEKQKKLQRMNEQLADKKKADEEYQSLLNAEEETQKQLDALGMPDTEGARSRLEEAEKSLEERTRAKAENEQLISEAEKKEREKAQLIKEAEEQQRRYNEICGRINEAEKQLAGLGTPDVDGAQAQLDETNALLEKTRRDKAECERLISEKQEILAELEVQRQAAADKKKLHDKICDEIGVKNKEIEDIGEHDVDGAQSVLDETNKRLDKVRQEQTEHDRLISEAEEKAHELKDKLSQNEAAKEKYNRLTDELADLQRSLDKLGEYDVEAVEKHLEVHKKLLEDAEQRKQTCRELEDEKLKLTQEIADNDARIKNLNSAVAQKKIDLDTKKKEHDRLDGERRLLLEKTGDLQTENMSLENELIPKAKKALDDAKEKNSELLKTHIDLVNEVGTIQNSTEELEQKVRNAEGLFNSKKKTEEHLQSELDLLSAKVVAKSQRIAELDEQIRELKKTADEDKKETLIRHREDDLKRLQELKKEIEHLENEISIISSEADDLEEKKQNYILHKKQLNERLAELLKILEGDQKNKIIRVEDQYRFINEVYTEFGRTADSIAQAVGKPELKRETDSFRKLCKTVDELTAYAGVLRSELIKVENYCNNNMELRVI